VEPVHHLSRVSVFVQVDPVRACGIRVFEV
jgi:hypothetical protein